MGAPRRKESYTHPDNHERGNRRDRRPPREEWETKVLRMVKWPVACPARPTRRGEFFAALKYTERGPHRTFVFGYWRVDPRSDSPEGYFMTLPGMPVEAEDRPFFLQLLDSMVKQLDQETKKAETKDGPPQDGLLEAPTSI